jgi:sugar phosphate isomerase/epimerase
LRELIQYASRYHIRLGLENRYHYLDIPGLDEMQALLELGDSVQLGFWYDVGHAQALSHLGFYPHEAWLKRFSARIVGVHLHDVRGITDHLSPGSGEVDFSMVASYLPPQAIRTLELQPNNTPAQVQAGLQYLREKGCIKN